VGDFLETLSHRPVRNRGRIIFVYSEFPLGREKDPKAIIDNLRDVIRRRVRSLAHVPTGQVAVNVIRKGKGGEETREVASTLLLHEHIFGLEGFDGGGYAAHVRIQSTRGGVVVVVYHNLTETEYNLLLEAINLMGWRLLSAEEPVVEV